MSKSQKQFYKVISESWIRKHTQQKLETGPHIKIPFSFDPDVIRVIRDLNWSMDLWKCCLSLHFNSIPVYLQDIVCSFSWNNLHNFRKIKQIHIGRSVSLVTNYAPVSFRNYLPKGWIVLNGCFQSTAKKVIA